MFLNTGFERSVFLDSKDHLVRSIDSYGQFNNLYQQHNSINQILEECEGGSEEEDNSPGDLYDYKSI